MVAPMTATRTPLLTTLTAWPTGPGRSRAGRRAASGWSADPALARFATPGDAARAVGHPACGAAVLTALAARWDDSWATTAALAGLAPRVAPIVGRWVRAGMCAADVEDAESDLLAGCLAGLRHSRPDRLLDPAGMVATAWQRASNDRRTLRARPPATPAGSLALCPTRFRSGAAAWRRSSSSSPTRSGPGASASPRPGRSGGRPRGGPAGRSRPAPGSQRPRCVPAAAAPSADSQPAARSVSRSAGGGREVLSVGVIGAAGVGYYLDTVGAGVDDYYLRAEPGRWLGAAATALGGSGTVDETALHRVLDGRHPGNGELLGAAMGKVAAFDLTFSAPKSVSLLAELSSEATRRAVLDAHRQAVAQAVGLLEVEAARGRRGHDGAVTLPVEGVIAAGFDHRTSRAGDPQLHTHVLVANRARGVDGRWGALYGRRIFGWARTVGFAYQAALRHELTTTLGVTWRPVTAGTAELAEIPTELTMLFSTRRAQITAELARTGASTPRAAHTAALATRPAKPDPVDPDIQRAAWADRAADAGLDLGVLHRFDSPGRRPAVPDPAALISTMAGPAGLTGRRSSFDRRAVIEAVCTAAPDGIPAVSLTPAADRVLTDPAFVATGSPGILAGPTSTTVELLAAKARILDGVTRRRDTAVAVCPAHTVDLAVADRPGLADEQADMVRRLCADGHGVEVVVGPAGTGKTWALDAARQAWHHAGIDVIGTALAARTARALEAGTGIPSATVDQLLADADRPGPQRLHGVLPAGGVVVVDEAGMVGTRKLDRLLHLAERSRTKVVLVGDPRQLPEIEAGGVLAALTHRHPVVELTVNRRQTETWERDALADLRAGRPDVAVTALTGHGRITVAPTADDARRRLLADWADTHTRQATPGQPATAVMVALTRSDVEDLNARAIDRLETLGFLDADRDRMNVRPGVSFGVGEAVLALRNDRRIGVVNGTTGTVTAVHPDTTSLTIRPDHAPNPSRGRGRGDEIEIPAGYLDDGHLTHGWAITVHKAQGLTVDRAFLLGTDRLYREAGYVALSRATTRTDWYHVAPDSLERTPDAELTRLLTRSQAQHLATPDQPPLTLGAAANLAERQLGSSPGIDGSGRRAREATVLADPSEHLVETLGPPPLAGPTRARWAEVAVLVDDYRTRHGLDGPDPLGPRPDQRHPDQTRQWTLARVAIADIRRHLGVDIDRSLGLDP